MTATEAASIPATPVYTITVTSSGTALVDGEPTAEASSPEDARIAALAEVRIKAALHGRPVRVLAKEADGSAWPMIVAADGTVTTLDHPHPTPPPPPAPTTPPTDEPTATIPPRKACQPMAADARTHAETSSTSDEWAAPLPPPYTAAFAELVTYENANRLVEAIIAAAQLETALESALGPHSPLTINVMTTRAALTMRRVEESEDWAETMDLLVQTAQRRRQAGAPEDETKRVISNAHALWVRLAVEDAEYARETAEPVLDLLGSHPDNKRRAQVVIRLLERGATA